MVTPKLNLELPYDLGTLLLDTHSKELKTGTLNRCLYTPVCSSMNHNSQKQPKCPSVDRWMDKQFVVHLLNEILFSLQKEGNSDAWVYLEAIVLSEMSQSQKDKQ